MIYFHFHLLLVVKIINSLDFSMETNCCEMLIVLNVIFNDILRSGFFSYHLVYFLFQLIPTCGLSLKGWYVQVSLRRHLMDIYIDIFSNCVGPSAQVVFFLISSSNCCWSMVKLI